jgi:hypothetical protein
MSYLDGAVGVKQVTADGMSTTIPARDTLHFRGAVTGVDDPVAGETVLTFSPPDSVAPVAVTVPTLTTDVSVLSVATIDPATLVRITASASVKVKGLEAPSSSGAVRKTLALLPGSSSVELTHQDTGAPANKRFICPFATSYFLVGSASVDVLYDATALAWRLIP